MPVQDIDAKMIRKILENDPFLEGNTPDVLVDIFKELKRKSPFILGKV